ncbi:serine hydrolase [Paracoccus sp. SY]|uniref:serine hydrolase domain-containing protein n=1 Tax=Paracoccus sp. SY TaxID=1330255 RepID=UPI001304E42B|nr:serine hydrolase domain-containing protein [Paracoccus sp. SY]
MTHQTIKSITVAACLGVVIAGTAFAQEAAAPDAALKEALDEALSAPVDRGDIPMAVGGITTADEAIYTGAFGVRSIEGEDAVSEDSVFNIASMTKAIVAAAAMQLVEQGKLDLDSPISTWLPVAKRLKVLDSFDAEGKPVLRDPKSEVTLRQLMTHTSGHGYTTWNEKLDQYVKATGPLPALDYEDEETWLRPLVFDPGEGWAYGEAIDWIGFLIREVSGQPLEDYVKEHVTGPLGMNDTGWTLTPEMEQRRVTSHERKEDGSLAATDYITDQNPARDYGGGGMYSTVPDYMKFIRMILNDGTVNGTQILKPETVDMMAQNQMGENRVSMLTTYDPSRSADAEFFPGLEKTWGLSFMINEEVAPTGRPAGSLAWAGLRNTFFWIDRENDIGGVWMSQLLPFVDEKTIQAFYDFETAYYNTAKTTAAAN